MLYPLIENIIYFDLLDQGFFSIVFSTLFFIFLILINPIIRVVIIFLFALFGNILPIVFIFKNKKLLPYIIISIISLIIFIIFFIGYLLIGRAFILFR